jgi:hypothetical protein
MRRGASGNGCESLESFSIWDALTAKPAATATLRRSRGFATVWPELEKCPSLEESQVSPPLSSQESTLTVR